VDFGLNGSVWLVLRIVVVDGEGRLEEGRGGRGKGNDGEEDGEGLRKIEED
jgi:hypothetical protein